MWFPVTRHVSPSSHHLTRHQGLPTLSTRILVVEDDVRTADLIALYLRHAGHRVWCLGDGAAALDRIRDEEWDAVILDRMLPGADGLEVCRMAARDRSIPVVFVSALTLEEERLAGFEAGGDDYITKPFSPRELVARVTAVLRRRPPAADPTLRVGDLELAVNDRRADIAGARLDLTPSEYEVLRTLAERAGRGVPRHPAGAPPAATPTPCRARSTCTCATCAASSRLPRQDRRCESRRW